MEYREILARWMRAFGVSGYEREIAHAFQAEIARFADEVSIDRIGNVIARFQGTDPAAPTVMAFAHLDQLGFIVRKVEKNGSLQVDRLGGIPEKVLPGIPVVIQARDGSLVSGVFGNKSHHASSAEEKYKVDPVTSLFIDIGATSAEQARSLGIDVGCPVSYEPSFRCLAGDFISGTAVDDRGGLLALLAAAEKLHANRPRAAVALVATVWEEFNLRGAMIAARSVKPDITMSLDVVLAGDTPDLSHRYDNECGKGPAVILYSFHGRGTLNGTLPHAGLVRLAEETARREGIPLQRFASLGILTDSSYAQLEGEGMASVELGFPARYTHTPVEVANLRDILQLGRLTAAMCQGIGPDFPLNRYD